MDAQGIDAEQKQKLLKTATRASVGVSVCLVLAKAFAWLMTGSVVVFASLLDSLMDTAASATNLFAVDYSLKPPDADHRFGHGKAEALAGLGQAVLITLSAAFLLNHAVHQLLQPEPVVNIATALWVIGFALVLTCALVLYQRYVVRQTQSTAIAADSVHYLSDVLTNVATLVSLLLTQLGWLHADALFGLLIGVYILVSAVRVGWASIRILMDEELPEAERQLIIDEVLAESGVLGVQRFRSWRSGQRRVVNLDVVFDGQRSLHDINVNCRAIVARLAAMESELDVSITPVAQPPLSAEPGVPG
ncbi:MAG: cation diffusion facilitator family transporter [bacterium]